VDETDVDETDVDETDVDETDVDETDVDETDGPVSDRWTPAGPRLVLPWMGGFKHVPDDQKRPPG
jgi:hypothetical protein